MDVPASPLQDYNERRQWALTEARRLQSLYESRKRNHRLIYYVLQLGTIILSGLTPVLLLWSGIPQVIQALPAALASMFATINSIFHFQENWIQYSRTDHAIRGEIRNFIGRATQDYATDLTADQALSNFINNLTTIEQTERSEFVVRHLRSVEEGKPG